MNLFPMAVFNVNFWRYKKFLFTAIFFLSGIFSYTFAFAENFYAQYEEKANEIIAQMTKEEKIGQMLLPTFNFLTADRGPNAAAEAQAAWFTEPDLYTLGVICGFEAISQFHIGGVLQDAGPLVYSGDDQSLPQWQKVSTIAKLFYNGPAGTNLLLGTDAVHGNQHVTGTILFPHNIGFGATHNPKLIRKMGSWTKRNIQSSGFTWAFAPTVAVGHDYRWGRFYECFGSNNSVLKALTSNFIIGLQAIVNDTYMSGILANAKHFISDGDTEKGIDEGYSYSKSLKDTWKKNGAGYEAAVKVSVGSIMASYSSLNDIPMHFGGAFDILRQFTANGIRGSKDKIYKMDGFVVSDYVGVSRAAYKCLITKNTCGLLKCSEKLLGCCGCQGAFERNCGKKCSSSGDKEVSIFEVYVRAVAKAVNAGLDMLMIANNSAYVDPFDYNPRPPFNSESPLFYNKIQTVVAALTAAIDRGLFLMKDSTMLSRVLFELN